VVTPGFYRKGYTIGVSARFPVSPETICGAEMLRGRCGSPTPWGVAPRALHSSAPHHHTPMRSPRSRRRSPAPHRVQDDADRSVCPASLGEERRPVPSFGGQSLSLAGEPEDHRLVGLIFFSTKLFLSQHVVSTLFLPVS